MNCQLCQNELNAYLLEQIPSNTKALIEAHLNNCAHCMQLYNMQVIVNKTIESEKAIISNPFLATRIMAGIEAIEQKQTNINWTPAFQKVFRPIVISFSVAAAIAIGVFVGNIYKPTQINNNIPQEMAYMDDAALESINIFSEN